MLIKNDDNLAVRTWVEIDRGALADNYQTFRHLIKPDCQLMAIAKSNAYGHGLIEYAQLMQGLGADWLAVDSILEGFKLRQNKITVPILVLGYTFPELMVEALVDNLSITISSFENLAALADEKLAGLKIHLKFDTGMHRQGFFSTDLPQVLAQLKKIPNIKLEGVFTHLAAAGDLNAPEATLNQLAEFEKIKKEILDQGFKPLFHAAASSGTLLYPQAHYDLVRPGISLFGLWPSIQAKNSCASKVELKPALTWKSIVSEIKNLPADAPVGYDLTESLPVDGRIAIIPVGYWHGYDRSLSGLGRVIIKGQPAKVLGRVSMDMLIVDISQIKDAVVGDEAILLGEGFSAEQMAELAETTNYEIITRLNPLIKRVYLN